MGTVAAVCVLDNGVVYLTQHGHRTYIEGCITGLTPGLHGFHIHEYGDLTDGCTSACAHYNPFHQVHGGPSDRVRHVGDLGNIEAGPDGVATFGFWDPVIRLKGPYSVIGRAVVVHADPDDLGHGHDDSATTGHAGQRIACGVIGYRA